jgi:hypothetical protein
MQRKISMFKFLRNIVVVAFLSGLFFGTIGLLVAGTVGLINMAILGFVFAGAGCFAMELSIIFEARSWESSLNHGSAMSLENQPWFLQQELAHKSE